MHHLKALAQSFPKTYTFTKSQAGQNRHSGRMDLSLGLDLVVVLMLTVAAWSARGPHPSSNSEVIRPAFPAPTVAARYRAWGRVLCVGPPTLARGPTRRLGGHGVHLEAS